MFKTRTEFWGRQKNTVGGWLKAENTNREAACKKAGKEFIPWTREDFDVLDIQTPDPVENCLHTIKCKANAVLNYLGIPEDRCVGSTWRHR
ncbi:putative 5'-exodeoxyribonuclease [Enterobacteria phage ECGD1] [Escherichia phage vB_Eco_Alma]|nr:putative 5'-exodeoxyribonuclease [Enterobacteria phage ECGD1] [Escherichia phage vB_Eco_Alma]